MKILLVFFVLAVSVNVRCVFGDDLNDLKQSVKFLSERVEKLEESNGILIESMKQKIQGMATQWAHKHQIDVKMFSVSWHNINRPDFDTLLMSDFKYQLDINTQGQYDVKNVSRK